MLFLLAMSKIRESQSLSMKALCKTNILAAEISKLDKGIAVDLHKFTQGRTAEQIRNLPQCKE
jgi:hypothetical protein